MIATLVLLTLGALQDDTIYRNDPSRGAYDKAVEACKDAEKLLASSPEAALEKLAPVFDGLERKLFKLVERRIFIEVKAQESNPHDFYPYHLRGRARLLVARKHKDEEARRLLIDAATDLLASVARNADRSRDPLAAAQKELWDNLRAALAYDGWNPDRGALVDQGLALIAAGELSKEAVDWIAGEVGRVDARLRELRKSTDLEARRPPARQAARWCEEVGAAVQNLAPFQAAQAAAGKTGSLAASIRDSRGTFRLKIGVSPWARVERLARSGEVIALADRDTPLLVPQELEIGEYTVDLVHQNSRKTATISAKSLQPGRTYVLWGDMSGDEFKVAELPRQ